jgi:hypothetical protein
LTTQLKADFNRERALTKELTKLQKRVSELKLWKWVGSYINRLTPLIETEEDRQELENFIEKMENKKRAKEEEEEQKERLKLQE